MIDAATYSAATPAAAAALRPAYPAVFIKKTDAAADAAAADFAKVLAAPAPAAAPEKTANSAASGSADGAEPPSFLGFLKTLFDIINPLQHIPVIGALYRHMTGDEINPAARLAGDVLYGGVIGGAISVADLAYQQATGRDVGETVIAAFNDTGPAPAPAAPEKTQVVRKEDIIWTTPEEQAAATPLPKEMIASKMMEALDKYGAMKRPAPAPTVSGTY